MRRLARPLIAALLGAGALLGSSGSIAEIYKWVDQKGVTNYSSTPPATGRVQTLDPDAVSVSVYPAPAPQDAARARESAMNQRVARIENDLRAQRQAQQAATQSDGVPASPPASPYDYAATRYYPAVPYYSAAPVFVVGRSNALTPFTRNPPAGMSVRFPHSTGGSTRTAGHRGPIGPRKL